MWWKRVVFRSPLRLLPECRPLHCLVRFPPLTPTPPFWKILLEGMRQPQNRLSCQTSISVSRWRPRGRGSLRFLKVECDTSCDPTRAIPADSLSLKWLVQICFWSGLGTSFTHTGRTRTWSCFDGLPPRFSPTDSPQGWAPSLDGSPVISTGRMWKR
jgi:hypothetical protein